METKLKPPMRCSRNPLDYKATRKEKRNCGGFHVWTVKIREWKICTWFLVANFHIDYYKIWKPHDRDSAQASILTARQLAWNGVSDFISSSRYYDVCIDIIFHLINKWLLQSKATYIFSDFYILFARYTEMKWIEFGILSGSQRALIT